MSKAQHTADGKERQFRRDEVTEEISQWSSVTGRFEAETTWTNGQALDTNVSIEIKDIAITWADRNELMRELGMVLRRFII